MRIAFLVHDYHRNGGHSRYVAELATRFADQHEVHVFSNTFDEPFRQNIRHHPVYAVRRNALATILSFAPAVSTAVKKAGTFDIVHAQGFCGYRQNVMTAHMSQIGWFKAVEAHGVPQSLRKRLFRRVVTMLENWAYRQGAADAFIAVSEKLKRELASFHQLHENVNVIHHGVDTTTFHPENQLTYRERVRSELNLNQSEKVGLYVGDWQKANRTLTSIVERHRDFRLLVVSKTKRHEMEKEIAELGLHDRIILASPTNEIQRYYAAVDFFLFPSFYDTFGMVVAEAMSAGLPVLVASSAGASEWIEDSKNGLIVKSVADLDEWDHAIRRLLDDSQLRDRLGMAARQTCLEHSWDKVALQTMNLYQHVVDDVARKQ